ncbi:NACHT domain-containing protein [Mycolicibacterium fortuitum]|uniref:NACHT domain-containing protein n=1 Tax=Mycolicibacterium fortuitum TaxID=1766 RepID=UPI001CDBFC63|nr:NACHT domain-containing protein [Mycolicibacterium fortuitum]UBV17774.1 NACHT domain-containing protein [Mycolicibacterium fortuitum]
MLVVPAGVAVYILLAGGVVAASPWLGVVGVVLTSTLGLLPLAPSRLRPGRGVGGGADPVADADEFAVAMKTTIKREFERCLVEDPSPISLRWRRWDGSLLDHPANSLGAESLPGLVDDRSIYAFYRAIHSGRLVILGDVGAGKSMLAMRLAMELLKHRSSGGVVPVIVNLADWDAQTLSLRDWLAVELPRKYESLRGARGGGTVASLLMGRGLLLPILDGFDELHADSYVAALQALNMAAGLPLVVTSRPAEFAAAVAGADVLSRADGIVIQALSFEDFEDYLPVTTCRVGAGGGNLWQEALVRFHDDPAAAPVREAMTSPLIAFLLRVVYSEMRSDRDPLELLDARFATSHDVERYLLGSFIDVTYSYGRSPLQPSDVSRWLGGMARHMQSRSRVDMGWWDLRDMAGALERAVVFAVVGALGGAAVLSYLSPWFGAGIGAGLGIGVAINPSGPVPSVLRLGSRPRWAAAGRNSAAALLGALISLHIGLWLFPERGAAGFRSLREVFPNTWWAVGIGLSVGLLLGWADSLGKQVSPLLSSGVGWAASKFGPMVSRFRRSTGVARAERADSASLLVAFLWGAVTSLLVGWAMGPWPGFWFGAFVGVVPAVVSGVEGAPELAEIPSAAASLRRDRTVSIAKGVGFGATVGVPIAVFSWPAGVVTALLLGLSTGVANGAGVAVGMNAWGHWVVLTRFWLVVTRRLPGHVLTFLDDAHEKGVLRRVGELYQFRHGNLQHALADSSRAHRHSDESVADLMRDGEMESASG